MEGQEYLEKYKPKRIEDFLGNRIQRQTLTSFLDNNDDLGIIIIGPSGSGKTLFCDLIFESLGLTVFKPNYESFLCHKDVEQYVESFLKTKSILDMFSKTKKVLFLDDVEVLLTQDRYANTYMQHVFLNSSTPSTHKVVITCTNGEEKKLTELKKKFKTIRLVNPQVKDTLAFVLNILDQEDYEYDDVEVLNVIKSYQCNVRNILLNLFSHSDIDEEKVMRTYNDLNIFDMVEKVFNNNLTLNELDVALSSDPTLCSFMMYDNYKNVFNSKYVIDNSKDVNTYIYKAYIDASCLEDYAFKNNEWDLIELANLLKCGSIKAVQGSLKKKKSESESRINYTQITTRAAQHYNTKKRIKTYTDQYNISPENLIFLSEICFELNKKVNAKSDEGHVVMAYTNNICSKDNHVYKNRNIYFYSITDPNYLVEKTIN